MLGCERRRRRRERAEANLRSSGATVAREQRRESISAHCNYRDADSQFRRTRSGWVARERSGATTVARGGLPIRALAYRGRWVSVKGRVRELAGRAEREGGGAASLTSRRREGEVGNNKCLQHAPGGHTDAERLARCTGMTV